MIYKGNEGILMKSILKAVACASSLVLMASAFAACSPNDSDTEPTTTTAQTTTTIATTTTQHGVLSASDVIVRSGPGLDYDAIGGITYNEDVVILGREGDWYRIRFGDQIGYISAQYIDTDDAPNASEMVEGLKTTSTTKKTTKATTTTKAGAATTTKVGETTKVGNTTKSGVTTTTKTGQTVDATITTVSTDKGSVTTTTTGEDMPVINDGIPETVIRDDF